MNETEMTQAIHEYINTDPHISDLQRFTRGIGTRLQFELIKDAAIAEQQLANDPNVQTITLDEMHCQADSETDEPRSDQEARS